MIETEGYKAFHGDLEITPLIKGIKNSGFSSFG